MSSSETQAIQTVNPRHLGSREEIVVVRNRIVSMLPNSHDLPEEIQWSLAQMAVAYRLDPFNGEIYVAKLGREKVAGTQNDWRDRYQVVIGIRGLRALARRQANYVVSPVRVMDAEEVKDFRRQEYDPQDLGVEIKVYRLDIASQCKMLDIPYHPSVGRGFWRAKAAAIKDKTGKITGWRPDNIPETWTAHEVAEKRAERNALAKAFDLRVPDNLTDASYDFDADLVSVADDRDRDRAIMQPPSRVVVEEDGEILYAREDR